MTEALKSLLQRAEDDLTASLAQFVHPEGRAAAAARLDRLINDIGNGSIDRSPNEFWRNRAYSKAI